MGLDAQLGARSIHTEDAPESQSIRAHPFLGEIARQAFTGGAHLAPVLGVRHGGPRSPRRWGIKHAQLSRASVKAGQQEALESRQVEHPGESHTVRVAEHGPHLGWVPGPTRLTIRAGDLEKLVRRADTELMLGVTSPEQLASLACGSRLPGTID